MTEVDAQEVCPEFSGAVDAVAENKQANRQKVKTLRVPSNWTIQSIQDFLIYLATNFWGGLVALLDFPIVKVCLEVQF